MRITTVTLQWSLVIISSILWGNLTQANTSNWGSDSTWSSSDRAPTSYSKKSNIQKEGPAVSPFSPGSNNIAIDLGQVFLLGDLGSNYSDSIGLQAHYTYGVSDLFGFDTSIGYSEHGDGKFSMATAMAGLRTNLAWYDKVVPYVVFGLGFYKQSYEFARPSLGDKPESISPLLFGVHLGPGINLELTKNLFFGAAITFHDVFGDSKPLSDGSRFDVGGTFTTFLLHAGFTF